MEAFIITYISSDTPDSEFKSYLGGEDLADVEVEAKRLRVRAVVGRHGVTVACATGRDKVGGATAGGAVRDPRGRDARCLPGRGRDAPAGRVSRR